MDWDTSEHWPDWDAAPDGAVPDDRGANLDIVCPDGPTEATLEAVCDAAGHAPLRFHLADGRTLRARLEAYDTDVVVLGAVEPGDSVDDLPDVDPVTVTCEVARSQLVRIVW